jgi:hypothetical protein
MVVFPGTISFSGTGVAETVTIAGGVVVAPAVCPQGIEGDIRAELANAMANPIEINKMGRSALGMLASSN